MLRCHDIQKIASDYIDKRLPITQRIKIRLHIVICHHCNRFVKQLRATISVIQRLPANEPSTDVVDAQVERLLKQRGDKP